MTELHNQLAPLGNGEGSVERKDRGLGALGKRFGSFEAGLGCRLPAIVGIELEVFAIPMFHAAGKSMFTVEIGLSPTDGDG